MSLTAILPPLLTRNVGMIQRHLSDFSDEDMMVRPVPAANHAAWQMTHLLNSLIGVAKTINPTATFDLPATFETAHAKEAARIDDPARFPSKTELIKLLGAVIEAQLTSLKSMSDADLDKPAPEKYTAYAPTIGMLLLMGPLHTSMHIGQFQVIRRKLGKPVLF